MKKKIGTRTLKTPGNVTTAKISMKLLQNRKLHKIPEGQLYAYHTDTCRKLTPLLNDSYNILCHLFSSFVTYEYFRLNKITINM